MTSTVRSNSRPVSSHGPNQQTSLRPRNRRLISGLDDPPELSANAPQSTLNSPFASPFASRAPSPLPSKHPSRSSSAVPIRRNGNSQQDFGGELATSLSGLWGKSWTSLQGLASNVLGSDAAGETIKDKSPQRSRRPIRATHSTWGPELRDQSQPGAGSREERKAMVRDKKRQELLMSTSNPTADSTRYKRRTSDDYDSHSAIREEAVLDAMVYVYNVKREDTLAGICIRFSCQLGIVKKANRLWSNDAVQSRKVIVIPVDACAVRGKRVPSPAPAPAAAASSPEIDPASQTSLGPQAFGHTPKSSISASVPVSPQSVITRAEAEEPPWKHDSWIQLDGHAGPVEIARMSRQDLGFFPRARRKSKSYSDLDTPSASFEIPRPSITVSDVTSTSCAPPMHRKRGSSGSNTRWMAKMSGPGGVGTLGGRGASMPGPAGDSFNKASERLGKAIGKHLPSVAPTRETTEDFDDNLSQTSGQGNTGLENFGGAIEGWARKLAQSAAKLVEQPLPSQLESRRNLGLRTSGQGGDLIELSNAFEIGADEEEEEDQHEEHLRGRALQQPGMPARRIRQSKTNEHDAGKSKGD